MNSFACQTITCIEDSGIFKEGRSYYCFAETEGALWIHAPWLLETLGVNQLKVPISTKCKFAIKS
jgi:hypothetical protein